MNKGKYMNRIDEIFYNITSDINNSWEDYTEDQKDRIMKSIIKMSIDFDTIDYESEENTICYG